MRLLGIDYGTKRIGISISDDGGRLAFPYTTFTNNKELIKEISLVIDEYKVERIVIGESKNYEMKDNQIMDDIRDFVEDLKRQINIEVVLHSEFMTSAQVSKEHFQATREAGRNIKKKNVAENIDAKAATIMLQSYIDSN